MQHDKILRLLNDIQRGTVSPEDAVLQLKKAPFEDLGYANIDHQRSLRHGIPEVIYGAGKSAEQIAGIVTAMKERGNECVLITRLEQEKADALASLISVSYDPVSRIGIFGKKPITNTSGFIAVVSAGTSDMSVAEEAAVTAEVLANRVERFYDVGVAGLHRLLSRLDTLMTAKVIIAVAGMEGALATVVGGLVSCPVIAVPTSIGYGSNFSGLSALLSMLNSCAGNVSVVNIDNGFGAGYLASLINHIGEAVP